MSNQGFADPTTVHFDLKSSHPCPAVSLSNIVHDNESVTNNNVPSDNNCSTLQISRAVLPPEYKDDTAVDGLLAIVANANIEPEPPPLPDSPGNLDAAVINHLLDNVYSKHVHLLTEDNVNVHSFWLLTDVQADGGANVSLANDLSLLHTYWRICSKRVGGIGSGVTCMNQGFFHLACTDASVLAVSMYFFKDAKDTVISLTDIVLGPESNFDTWWQVSECRKGTGKLRCSSQDVLHSAKVRLRMSNKLWYIVQDAKTTRYQSHVVRLDDALVRCLTGTAVHDLRHHRLGHPSTFVTNLVAKSCDGVPSLRLRHPHFHYKACLRGKMSKHLRTRDKTLTPATRPGKQFYMDYGFVCAPPHSNAKTASLTVTTNPTCPSSVG